LTQRDQLRANFLQVLCSIWRLFLRPALCASGSAQTRSRPKGEAHETGWGTASDGHALGVAPRWSVRDGPRLWCRRREFPPHAPVSLTRYGPAKAVFPIPAVLQERHVHTMDPRYSASVDGGCAAERTGTRCAAVGRGDQPGGLSRTALYRGTAAATSRPLLGLASIDPQRLVPKCPHPAAVPARFIL
jgi:hypothetical protein